MCQDIFRGIVILIGVAVWLDSSAKIIGDNDSVVMRREADAFLASMPPGLQQLQTNAVAAAIDGDCRLLKEVRSSRNRLPEYSANVSVKDFTITADNGRNIPVRLYSPLAEEESEALPLLIYFHGGGWTFGSINSCARFCDAIASTGQAKVLAVDYALAPEHPYPEGLLDCVAAVEYAFGHSRELGIERNFISLGGDSSGGNLALSAALRNVDDGCMSIRSVVLFYPVIVAENDGSETWKLYGEGFGLDSCLMEKFNEAYCACDDAKEEAVSPGYAVDLRLQKLPPVLLVGAERDILASQGSALAARLRELDGEINHVILPGTVHLFITVGGQDTAFNKSVELASSFLSK